jgi:hypothetical protein
VPRITGNRSDLDGLSQIYQNQSTIAPLRKKITGRIILSARNETIIQNRKRTSQPVRGSSYHSKSRLTRRIIRRRSRDLLELEMGTINSSTLDDSIEKNKGSQTSKENPQWKQGPPKPRPS